MKDKSFFSGAGDLRQKLNDTVIRYKDEPYYCQANGSEETIWLSPFGKEKTDATPFAVSPDDRDLLFASPPLGFANHKKHCTYVSRLPARRSIQGLNESNMVHWTLGGQEVGALSGWFLSSSMYDCIMGQYPAFSKILGKALTTKGEEYSQAFSRHFAVRKAPNETILLYHRLQQIGEYDRTWARFTLIPTYNNPVVLTQLTTLGVPVNES